MRPARAGSRPGAPVPTVSPLLVRRLAALERGSVALLVLVLVGFGVWTLAYQVALATGLGSTPTLVVSLPLTAAAWYAVVPAFLHRSPDGDSPRMSMRLLVAVLVVAVVVVGLGSLGHRGLMIAVVVLAAAGWVVAQLVRGGSLSVRRRATPEGADQGAAADAARPLESGLWLTTWFWALACAVLASVSARPDGDDAYFVNLAQYVADRGDFPTRDTMLSDQQFPALSSHSPPVHSIEGFIGAVGHLTGLGGGTLTYLVATPVLTALAVLTLGWLVSLCRIRHAPLALTAGVVFLLASGGSGASYGNFFALRMWQGKATLATLVIPLVTAVAIAYVGRGGWRRWLTLALGVVATIGASNTAVFLVPVLIAGVVVGALVHAGPRRAIGAAATLAYPVLCGAAVIALAPTASAGGGGDGEPTTPMNPLVAVPGLHGLFVVVALAITLGWLGVRSGAARATVVGATLAAGVALLPPVTDLLVSAAGVRSVIWRMWWVVPVPLLAAALVGAAPEALRALGKLGNRRAVRAAAALTSAAVVAFVPLVGGSWILSTENGARFVSPLSWKVPTDAEAEARAALGMSRRGDVILAPWDVSRALAGMSVEVHPVSARFIYLPAYRSSPDAHVAERTELQRFVDSRTPDPESLRPLVAVLSVDTACVSTKRGRAVAALRQIGFHVVAQEEELTCLRR